MTIIQQQYQLRTISDRPLSLSIVGECNNNNNSMYTSSPQPPKQPQPQQQQRPYPNGLMMKRTIRIRQRRRRTSSHVVVSLPLFLLVVLPVLFSNTTTTTTTTKLVLFPNTMLLFCHGQSSSSSSSSSSVLSGGEDGLDGKDIPQKGDTKCPSLADRFHYFATHQNNNTQQQDAAADIWLLPCEEDNNNNGDGDGDGSFFGGFDNNNNNNDDSMLLPTELPSHAITLSMYAALPAFASDFRTLFSWGVVGFLDEISLEYDVLSNFSIPLNFTERRKDPKNIDAQIIFQYVISNNIKEHEASWWYQYKFIFYCFYGNAHGNLLEGKPILNTDIDIYQTNNNTLKLKKVQQRLNHYLRYGIDIINAFNVRSLSYGILGISIEDPTYSITPFLDGPPTLSPTFSPSLSSSYDTDIVPTINNNNNNNGTNTDNNNENNNENAAEEEEDDNDDILPPSDTIPTQNHSNYDGNHNNINNINGDTEGTYSEFITYTSPINVQLWDWRRFLGLFLFMGTLIGMMILTQLASYRRRQRMKQTIWGNIGTEQGVEALLSTGWKFKDSTLMEVYNKAGMGYRDDDSMLLGGYEQTHTTTTTTTTTTTNTAMGGGGGGGETSSGEEGGGRNVSSSLLLLQPETSYGGGIGGEITFTQDGSLSTPEYPSDGNS